MPYEIVNDGLITYNYGFLANGDSSDTIRYFGDVKSGMVVKLSAEGKPDKVFYHEIESTDSKVIDAALSALSQEYEVAQ